MPLDFNFELFLDAIVTVLAGEHALCIAKCLQMIYNNFLLFKADIKRDLSKLLLQQLFLKLFMHWSHNVRDIFHHILFYRFYHLHRDIKTQISQLEDLEKEIVGLVENKRAFQLSERRCLINDEIKIQYAQTMKELQKLKKYAIKKEKERLYEHQQLISVSSYTEKLKFNLLKRKKQTLEQKAKKKHQNKSLEPKPLRKRLQSVCYNYQEDDERTPPVEMEIQSEKNQDDVSNQSVIFVENQIAEFFEIPSKQESRKYSEFEELKLDSKKINSTFRYSQYSQSQSQTIKNNLVSTKLSFKINRNQVIYFLKSHSQFEDVKKEYLKWLIHKQQELRGKNLTEKEQNSLLLRVIPPEVQVQVPCDIEEKSHSYEDLTDDW